MNAERRFVDTNVVVYLFDTDAPDKQAVARQLFNDTKISLVISTQVLQEFYVTVTRKLKASLDPDTAYRAVNQLAEMPVRQVSKSLVLTAIQRSIRSKLSFWDSLIVETALDSGAAVLLSEDMQHDQVFDGLRIQNPFLETPARPH